MFFFLLYLFFLLILLYIHVLVYSIVIYPVDSILYYRYVGLFTSVQIYSVLFIYILLTLISLYHVELCWSSLLISILFYIFTFSYVFLVYSLFWFCSALHYVLDYSFLFYSILLYSIDSVLTVVYWPLHFCSVLFSYILLTFIICHVQLCCSILFMHYSSIIFFKSILFILILLYSDVLFILSSVLVRSLLSLITCTTVGESHLLSNKNALGMCEF